MNNFKENYKDYITVNEKQHRVPDTGMICEYCSQNKTGSRYISKNIVRTAVAVAMCAVMVIVVTKINIISYGYDKIQSIVSGKLLKSKEAETTTMKVEEERMIFEKTFSKVSEATKEYQLKIMESNLAYPWEDAYTVVLGYGTSDKINGIRIIAPYYIMGDLPVHKEYLTSPDNTAIINPLKHGIYGDNDYSDDLYEGKKYQTPIYLSVYMNVSGADIEYGGIDASGETYTSLMNGMKCSIVAEEFVVEEHKDGLNTMVTATGMKDDVIYKLEGRVSVDTMKEIIDSFSYME